MLKISNKNSLALQKNTMGFTLIETFVTIGILLFMIVAGGDFIINGFRAITYESEQQTAVQSARKAMSIMKKEIRGINNSDQGDYPIKTYEEHNFSFYSDINYNGENELVRYFLSSSTLYKVVTPPGPLNDYSGSGATTTIAEYMNNQEEEIFVYYNSNRNETSDIDQIRLINIVLKINVTPWRMPNDYYIETDVNLRNLKTNL